MRLKNLLLFLMLGVTTILLASCEKKTAPSTAQPPAPSTQTAAPATTTQQQPASAPKASASKPSVSSTTRVVTPAPVIVENPGLAPAGKAAVTKRAVTKPVRRAGAYQYRRNHP